MTLDPTLLPNTTPLQAKPLPANTERPQSSFHPHAADQRCRLKLSASFFHLVTGSHPTPWS